MKKALALLCAILLVTVFTACGGESSTDPLSAIDGASAAQREAILKVLEDNNISVKSCAKAEVESTGDDMGNAIAAALGDSYSPSETHFRVSTSGHSQLTAEYWPCVNDSIFFLPAL